ncbi:MAG: ATP-binding protein [Spirochaetes bacterium]|nr:ATP-binding protein [Spirochaetota bacterium]
MIKSLRSKLIIVYSIALIFFISFLLFYIHKHIQNEFTSFLRDELKQNIEYIHTYCQSFHRPINKNFFNYEIVTALKNVAQKSSLRITIIQHDGTVLFDTDANPELMENHSYRPEILEARKNGTGMSIRFSNTIGADMLYVASFYDSYYIRTAKSLTNINTLIESLTKNILFTGIIVLIISIAVTAIFANMFTKPIKESVQFINKFFNGDLTARILNYNDDEMGYLQKSMNLLADNIQQRINELTNEKNKLFMIIESIHDPIALIDEDKKIAIYNKAFANCFEYPENITNKYYFTVIRHSELNAKIHIAFSQKQRISFEETIAGNHFQIFIYPFTEPAKGILLLMHDVTEQKRIQQLKSDLVGNLSHELKTPISIIRGYLETIKDNICDQKTAEQFIESALTNVERQNAIINDMLKLNQLETSSYPVTESINLKKIINQCVELLMPKIQKKNLAIVMDIESLPQKVLGNAFLAEEIFFNLIDNAINYNNEKGSITITATKNSQSLSIHITDTGIGIPHDEIPRIFERFYRVDKSRSRETGGTGLGLSIVKHAALILGWTVGVTSSSNGSTFTITIPH